MHALRGDQFTRDLEPRRERRSALSDPARYEHRLGPECARSCAELERDTRLPDARRAFEQQQPAVSGASLFKCGLQVAQ